MDGQGLWTLDELAGQVEAALSVDYPGAPSGRVRSVPDRRAIRWYTTIGLVDRPAALRGRTALYAERHLLQLVAIKRRQAIGRSLAQIQAELAGATYATLRSIAQLPDASDTPPHPPAAPPRVGRFWSATPAAAAPRAAPAAAISAASPAATQAPVATASAASPAATQAPVATASAASPATTQTPVATASTAPAAATGRAPVPEPHAAAAPASASVVASTSARVARAERNPATAPEGDPAGRALPTAGLLATRPAGSVGPKAAAPADAGAGALAARPPDPASLSTEATGGAQLAASGSPIDRDVRPGGRLDGGAACWEGPPGGLRVAHAVTLPGGVALLLPAGAPYPTDDDLHAIHATAAPLLAELTRRGLSDAEFTEG